MLPAALYGAETSFAADFSLRRLRGAVFSVLRPKCHMGGNAVHLFAEAAVRGHEVDPELLIAYRRVAAMDRAWRNDPVMGARMSRVLAAYRRDERPEGGHESPPELKPIPPPG